MWEGLWSAMPVIAGAAVLFVMFCAALIIFENKSEKKAVRMAKARHNGFSHAEKQRLQNVTPPALKFPKAS